MCWCGQLCPNLISLQDKRGNFLKFLEDSRKEVVLFDTCRCAGCLRKNSKRRSYIKKEAVSVCFDFFREKNDLVLTSVLFNGLAWAKKKEKNSQERHPKNMLQLFCIKKWAKIPCKCCTTEGAIKSIWWRLLAIKQV